MVKTAENSQSPSLGFGGKPPFSVNVVKGSNVELINELGDARIIASDRLVSELTSAGIPAHLDNASELKSTGISLETAENSQNGNSRFGRKPPFMSPWENECGFDSPDLADQNMVVYSVRATVEQTLFISFSMVQGCHY